MGAWYVTAFSSPAIVVALFWGASLGADSSEIFASVMTEDLVFPSSSHYTL